MRLRLEDVLVRAAQRGYTAEEIMPCLIKDLGDGWYEVDVDHQAYPRTLRPGHTPPMGLGDFVKAGLSALGITEERMTALIGKPCGCSKRAAKLNEMGAKYLGLPAGSTPENTG